MGRDLTELNKLEDYLKENGEVYERVDADGYSPLPEWPELVVGEQHQIIVPHFGEGYEWDAICQRGSYGCEEGLQEIYGNIVNEDDGDSVVGYLTAEDVIKRLEDKHD